jgi:hypothetical protein
MPIEVLHQIQYLCKNIPKVEWSGALFYTTEGSIVNPDTFKITLKTILPLDMGSSAYTEYHLDDRFIDFIEEDFEERCTWKLGHIHSHNTMAVFFSGTDMAELNDNAPAHNFYLSFIVNNYMDFIAKVAFIGEAKKDVRQVPYTAKTADGHDYIIEKQDFVVDNKKLFIYNCEIDTPKNEILVSEQFTAQVKKIMEPKPVKTIVNQPSFQSQSGKSWQRTPQTPRQFKSQEDREMESWNKSFQNNKKPFNNWEDWDYTNSLSVIEDSEEDLKAMSIYNFAKELFNFTNSENDEEETLEDVLDMVAEFMLTPAELAKSVITEYAKDFNKHFPKANASEFIQYTHETLDLLEDLKVLYPEISLTIKTITSMINKFIEDETSKRHNPTV